MLANLSRRSLRFLGLAAVVAVMHGWLLNSHLRPLGGGGVAPAPEVARMTLVATPKALPPPAAPDTAAADRPPGQVLPTMAVRRPMAKAPEVPAHAFFADGLSERRVPASAGDNVPSPVPVSVEATEAPVAAPALLAGQATPPSGDPAPQALAASPADAGLTAPPSPAVAASAAARWRYQVSRGAASGDGELQWTPEGKGYELHLRAVAPGTPPIDWISRGQVGADGLAPDRMVERQRERETQAVNFQRDKGVISFSGPSRTEPLLPGAQDRVSWILQVAAQARARGDLQPGDLLRFQVASPRGDVDEWRFTVQPVVERLLSGQRIVLTHLLREPQRPHDLRVQLWLSRQFDHLPVGLAWAVEPDGIPLEMWLTALPVNY